MEDPKESTKKTILTKMRSASGRIQDQNKKLILFLCTSNEQSKNESEKMIAFIIASKRVKYTGKHLTKEVQNLFSEHYKTLKETKEDPIFGKNPMFMDWKIRHC